MTSKMGTHLGIFRARTALVGHLDTMRVQAPAEANSPTARTKRPNHTGCRRIERNRKPRKMRPSASTAILHRS